MKICLTRGWTKLIPILRRLSTISLWIWVRGSPLGSGRKDIRFLPMPFMSWGRNCGPPSTPHSLFWEAFADCLQLTAHSKFAKKWCTPIRNFKSSCGWIRIRLCVNLGNQLRLKKRCLFPLQLFSWSTINKRAAKCPAWLTLTGLLTSYFPSSRKVKVNPISAIELPPISYILITEKEIMLTLRRKIFFGQRRKPRTNFRVLSKISKLWSNLKSRYAKKAKK